jgi:hypothetical protein
VIEVNGFVGIYEKIKKVTAHPGQNITAATTQTSGSGGPLT